MANVRLTLEQIHTFIIKEVKIMQKIGQVKTQHCTWDVLWNSSTKEFSVGGKLVGTADTAQCCVLT